MARRIDLGGHLADLGCFVLREGGRHSIWINPRTETRTAVPRHREIPRSTARAICRQLGIPAA